jgi:hypothetical protein
MSEAKAGRTIERLEQWDALGDKLYEAVEVLMEAHSLAARVAGKNGRPAKSVDRLLVALNRERTRIEDVAAEQGYFDPPLISPIRGAWRRAEDRQRLENLERRLPA